MCRYACILMLVLPAGSCGKITDPAGDAGDSIDADTTDGGAGDPDANPRGTATVRVHSYDGLHTPIQGATVVFVDPGGTEVLRTATDALGVASADVLPGASVTVVMVRSNGADLRTVVGIEPGDDIVLGARRVTSPAAGSMTFSWPLYASAAAASYVVYTQCGVAYPGTATSVLVSFQEHCRPDTVELLVIANVGGYVAFKSVGAPFQGGGSVNLTGPWSTLGTATVNFTGIGPELNELGVMWRQVTDATSWQTSAYFTEAGSSTGSVTPQNAPGYGTAADVTLVILPDNGDVDRLQMQVRRVSGAPGSLGIDIGPSLLPWVGVTTVDATTRTVTAATTGTGTWDMTRFWLYYQRMVNTTYHDYTWVLYAPGGTTGLTLAELPDELATLVPAATDYISGETVILEGDTLSESQVRQLPDEIFGDEFCDRWDAWNGTSWRYSEDPPFSLRLSGVPNSD